MKHSLTLMMIMAFPYYCSSGKIKDLLLEGVVDGMTRLVLVNAIYFKGKWSREFKEEFTVDALFRLNKVTLYRQQTLKKKAAFWELLIVLHCKAVFIALDGKLELENDTCHDAKG